MQPQLFWIGSSLQAPPRSVASSWCRRFADAEEVWRQACLKTWATKQHSARIRTRVKDYGNLEIGFAGWMLGSGDKDLWFVEKVLYIYVICQHMLIYHYIRMSIASLFWSVLPQLVFFLGFSFHYKFTRGAGWLKPLTAEHQARKRREGLENTASDSLFLRISQG